jgi:type IV secretion system protein VirB10
MSGTIDGDRTRVADSPAASEKDEVRKRAVLATVAAVCLGLVVGGLYWLRPAPKPPIKTQAPIAMTSRFEPAQDAPAPKAAPPIKITPQAIQATLPPPPPVDTLLDSARRAPVTAFSRKSMLDAPAAQLAFADPIEAEDKGSFERRFEPPKFKGARAGLLGDRRFIVAQGTSIPCVLETALQSDQPGFCSCVITRDVLSDNGQVVLMEKGTQVIGQYRGGLA